MDLHIPSPDVPALTQADIDQRVFDLYDEYCHGRIDRRAFLQRRRWSLGGARDGAGADAALRRAQTISFTDERIKAQLRDLPVAGRQFRQDARLSRAARRATGRSRPCWWSTRTAASIPTSRTWRAACRRGLPRAGAGRAVAGGRLSRQRRRRPRRCRPSSTRRKLRTDMLNSAQLLKAHALSTGKLGVTGFCWGGGTTNYLAAAFGADLHAGRRSTARRRRPRRCRHQGAAAHPLRRERRAHRRDVAGLRGGAEGRQRALRDVHLSRARSTASTTTRRRATRRPLPSSPWDRTIALFKQRVG